MSTLSSLFGDTLSLLCPPQCIACSTVLENRAEWLCIDCRIKMPQTNFHLDPDNDMAEKLRGLSPAVVNAAAQHYFFMDGRWRVVIHEMKYRKSWYSAQKMGELYGHDLAESPLYKDIDVIIPVPLHLIRLLTRRYNQSELIARGIGKILKKKVDRSALKRVKYNASQTTKQSKDRWGNVQGIFAVKRPKELENKHILLVDDVFTTGATVLSCIDTIVASCPNCRISVVTLGISRKSVRNKEV